MSNYRHSHGPRYQVHLIKTAYNDAHGLEYKTALFLNDWYLLSGSHPPACDQFLQWKQTLGSAPDPPWLPWSSFQVISSSFSRFQPSHTELKQRDDCSSSKSNLQSIEPDPQD